MTGFSGDTRREEIARIRNCGAPLILFVFFFLRAPVTQSNLSAISHRALLDHILIALASVFITIIIVPTACQFSLPSHSRL